MKVGAIKSRLGSARNIVTCSMLAVAVLLQVSNRAVTLAAEISIADHARETGSDLLFLMPRQPPSSRLPRKLLTRLEKALPREAYSPVTSRYPSPCKNSREVVTVEVLGVRSSYFHLLGAKCLQGELWQGDSEFEKVVALGNEAARALNTVPNEILVVDGIPFRVCCLLESFKILGASDLDSSVFVPFSTATRRLWQEDGVSYAIVHEKWRSTLVDLAVSEDFILLSLKSIGDFKEGGTRKMRDLGSRIGVAFWIASSFGLIVTIGLSIRERFAEIGLRIALGATRMDVLSQFLGESIMLVSGGTALGAILAMPGAFIVFRFFHLSFRTQEIFVAISEAAIIASTIGILGGLLPAAYAANINPVAAIRSGDVG